MQKSANPTAANCDCYPWPDKCPYCDGQPIVGAFLMMHGVAPWEADELIRWLAKDGFEIKPIALSFSNGDL